MAEDARILEINGLTVRFPTSEGVVRAVDGVSLSLDRGETLGVVGESGCGKSVMLNSIMRLLEAPPARIGGEILYNGQDILKMPKRELFRIRGKEITMIFQEPMTSLNPVIKIGPQIAETMLLHELITKDEASAKALELLRQVEIPNAEECLGKYPHQLSGGMRQRVMIAMALACKPQILLADEPTTALDVTIQAQILALLRKLKDEYHMSMMIVTHDLGVIAEVSERVVVFYGGNVVEEAPTRALFDTPLHPYTEGLLGCIPHLSTKTGRLRVIEGNVPNPIDLPEGCVFAPRCPRRERLCVEERPALKEVGDAQGGKRHRVACHMA
ncbi:MAG: ABC transporter ATP-binding protein [Lachnospiraceae bacterium]|jgi:peptide/nickel transport system ATP-binding protein/oligopeptide transport system ATP-binding protein|nr:ABC transporter ATP-binding protein [Lachnospiraceae bacterium]